jgi:hypothetical protein
MIDHLVHFAADLIASAIATAIVGPPILRHLIARINRVEQVCQRTHGRPVREAREEV